MSDRVKQQEIRGGMPSGCAGAVSRRVRGTKVMAFVNMVSSMRSKHSTPLIGGCLKLVVSRCVVCTWSGVALFGDSSVARKVALRLIVFRREVGCECGSAAGSTSGFGLAAHTPWERCGSSPEAARHGLRLTTDTWDEPAAENEQCSCPPRRGSHSAIESTEMMPVWGSRPTRAAEIATLDPAVAQVCPGAPR